MILLYYIQEADKPKLFSKLFNIIKLQGDKIILPVNDKKLDIKKAQKLAKKTKKIFNLAKSKKIVISRKIQEQENYMNFLYSYNLDIVKGKWLFELLSSKILDYILEKKEIKKQETTITVLVNELSENMFENLKVITKQYKRVNIVTNHRERFKQLEKQLLDNDGIMITVGNNKKKSLAKSEVILNVDFPSELINLYNIYDEAIIVNLRNNVKILKKRFNGLCINDYDIFVGHEEDFDYDKKTKYKACEVYEANCNKRQPFEALMKQIEKDKVKCYCIKNKIV